MIQRTPGSGKPKEMFSPGMNRTEEALLAYDRAIYLDQKHFPGLEQKGDALMELGGYEEALAAYEKANRGRPGVSQALA